MHPLITLHSLESYTNVTVRFYDARVISLQMYGKIECSTNSHTFEAISHHRRLDQINKIQEVRQINQ